MALEQAELDKAVNEISKSLDAKGKEIEKNVKENIDSVEKGINEKIAKGVKEATAEIDNKIKAVSEQADKTELRLKGIKQVDPVNTDLSFAKAFAAAVSEKAAEIDAIVKADGKQSEPLVFNIQKAAVDMSVNNTIGSGSTAYSVTQNTGVVAVIRQRVERYLANVSTGRTDGNRVVWVEQTDEQGVPIFIAEGASKTPLSVLHVEQTANVKKIAVYGKVTTEMLADANYLISYIQNNFIKRLGVATEQQLLTGAGTGDTLKGLKTYATTFAAGALALAVDNANEFDVLTALALQVEVANGIPTAVFIHPSTIAKMKTLKSTTNEPLYKEYTDFLGDMVINGMKVIPTTAVTAGEFIGGDTTVANVLFRDAVTVQIGLDGNDFINNKKTILVEQRLVQYISANDTPVIVKGVFSTAKAALETV
jgi:hypothetical protein